MDGRCSGKQGEFAAFCRLPRDGRRLAPPALSRLEGFPDMHLAFLARISEEELLARIRGLQVTVPAVGVFAPIEGQSLLHHLGREVAPIGQEAPRNRSTVVIHVGDFCANRVALAEPVQRPFCVLAVRVVQLRRIDAKKTDLGVLDPDRVAIGDPGASRKDAGMRQMPRTLRVKGSSVTLRRLRR